MWPLLLCSVVSLAIVLERFWFWFKMKPEQDVANADLILSQLEKDRTSIPQLEHPGCICRVLTAGLCCGSDSVEKAMSIIAMRSIAKMRRGMNVLDTVIIDEGERTNYIKFLDMLTADFIKQLLRAIDLGTSIKIVHTINVI